MTMRTIARGRWPRLVVLGALISALAAVAAPVKGSSLRIKTRSGATVIGELVSETAQGFLLQNGGKTRLVLFTDVAEIEELAPAPAAAPPPPPPAEPPPPPPPVNRTPDPSGCQPGCRPGYLCFSGRCESACNPPCSDGRECSEALQCVDPNEVEERRAEEERNRQRAAMEAAGKGFHLGAQVNADSGITSSAAFVGFRAAVVGNVRLGAIDLRGSLGPLLLIPTGVSGLVGGGTLDVELRFLLGSRFALGLGGRVGAAYPETVLVCKGPGCGTTTVRGNVPALIAGGKVLPAIFRLGSQRAFELSAFASLNYLTTGVVFVGGGLELAWLFL